VNTVTAILDPDDEGCVHLPLPVEMRQDKVKVTAVLELVEAEGHGDRAQLVSGEFGRAVLVAPPGTPAMTPESIKAILEIEEWDSCV
jgi:hypothetical protein